MAPCPGACPGAIPGSRTTSNRPRASVRSRVSKTQRAWGGTKAACQFHCGENEIRASLISSAFVGATPTPATIFREVFRPPDCKSGVTKQGRKRRLARYQHFPPLKDLELNQRSIPLSAGRLRVQFPPGPPVSILPRCHCPGFMASRFSTPAFFSTVRSPQRVAQQPTHPAWDRGTAGATPATLTIFTRPPWSNR